MSSSDGWGLRVVADAFDEYLARAPERHRVGLRKLHQAVIAVTPEAEELISSGVPAFRYHGKPLVSIGTA